MAPIIEFTNWYKRNPDKTKQIEPYRKYFFLCEGANTERWYFESLINNRKSLGLHPLIDIRFLDKQGEDKNVSNPKRLLEYANDLKKGKKISFDPKHDKIIIVFDTDIYKNDVQSYLDLVHQALEDGHMIAVTNPSFELFLLLHHKDSYEKCILPNETEILQNKRFGKRRKIQIVFTNETGLNPKTNKKIGDLSKDIDIAIEQEKNLNQDIEIACQSLTSNIGLIISKIKNDKITS